MREVFAALGLGMILLTACSSDPLPTPVGNAAPVVSLSASPEEGTAPLAISFTAHASDPDGDDLTYSWSFGDGTISEGSRTETHVYEEPGLYEATVSVSDGNGPPVLAGQAITVFDAPSEEPPVPDEPPTKAENSPPVVALAADPVAGPAPLTTVLTAVAEDSDGDQLTYEWDLGNGTGKFQGEASVMAEYPTSGVYVATVTVVDGRGGSASDAVQVFAQEPATAQDLLIYGADSSGSYTTFLGCLNCPQSDPESVHNEFGTYGSEYSSTSIFNDFGPYGSPYSNTSSCNEFAQSPPIVVDEANNYYGELTLNEFRPDAITDPSIVNWLETVVCV